MSFIIPALLIATLAVVGGLVGTTFYRRYTGLTRGQSALLWLLAVGLAFCGIMVRREAMRNNHNSMQPFWQNAVVIVLLSLLAVPFIVRLYRKWIGGHLTDAEKLPDMDGVRAWLGVGNIICATLIPICLWQIFGVSCFGMLALTFGLLLAYPFLNMVSISSQPTQPMETKTEKLSTERERVLKMLDDGKINAQESAELLSALSLSDRVPEAKSSPASPQRKMVMVGLVLLLIGFFLPWFSVNLGDEMNRAMGNIQQGMNQMMPQNSGGNVQMPSLNMKTGSVNVAGGDLKYGLGWLILLIGIAAAALPYLAANLSAQDRQKATLIGLSIGGIILIYLLTQNIRFVSIGILLAMAGYALQFLGTLKEKQLRLG